VGCMILDIRVKDMPVPANIQITAQQFLLEQLRFHAAPADVLPAVIVADEAPAVIPDDKKRGIAGFLPPVKPRVPLHPAAVDLVAKEFNEYLEVQADRQADPLLWWRQNRHIYPRVAVVARKFLSLQATGAPVERVWSGVGDTLQPQRRRLDPERVEELTFLRENRVLLGDLVA